MVRSKTKQKITPGTQLEKNEKFLKGSIKHLEPILASIREAVIITDETGVIVLANSSTEIITGVLPGDLVGSKVQKVLTFECAKVNPSWFLSEALSGARAVKLPEGCSLSRRDGTKIPIMAIGAPLYAPNGTYAGIVLTLHDLIEEVRARNKEYEFLAYISHQIRSPLSLIRWSLEAILREKEKLDPRHEEMLQDLYRSSTRFKGFISDLIDISRLQIGKIKFNVTKINIRELVERAAQETKKIAVTHNITVITFPNIAAKESFIIQGDKDRLYDVFLNLITNAILYNRPQGTVTVEAQFEEREVVEYLALKSHGSEKISEYFQSMPTQEGPDKKQFLLVSVADTGVGIPKEQQEQTFGSFFRGDNVVEKGISGTGLGLFIVKSIVEGLGGRIFFQSKENVGTTFYVVFPIA